MRARLMGLFLLGLVRLLSGSQARWVGCPPKAEQRVYFANPGVTGASGLLDRVDALCFSAPLVFHSVRWYYDL